MKTASETKVSDYFLITTEQFYQGLGISESEFFKLKATGRIGPMAIEWGKRTLRWNPREISLWCDYGCPNRENWQSIWQGILKSGPQKN